MLEIRDPDALRRHVAAWRAASERVAFVPTMGALHAGHLSLVRRARELAPRTVASVFVNPTQFAPGEDFASYPRDPRRDADLLEREGCSLLFLPAVETLYPSGDATAIEVGGPAELFEGERRPGHFRGVATVVVKLLNLVTPDVAVFGEKDAQQLAVVRRVVRDLHLPVEIVAAPTVREADGLAMSSRNAYLDGDERRRAAVLHRALEAAREAVARGERRAAEIERRVRQALAAEPGVEVDYVGVVDAERFRPLEVLAGRCVVPVAARVGTTRLIDNLQLDLSAEPEAAPTAALTTAALTAV